MRGYPYIFCCEMEAASLFNMWLGSGREQKVFRLYFSEPEEGSWLVTTTRLSQDNIVTSITKANSWVIIMCSTEKYSCNLASLSATGVRCGMFLEFVLFVSRPDTLGEFDSSHCSILCYSVEYIILVFFQSCLLHCTSQVLITGHSFVHCFHKFFAQGSEWMVRLDLNLSRSAHINYYGVGGHTVDNYKLTKFDLSIASGPLQNLK